MAAYTKEQGQGDFEELYQVTIGMKISLAFTAFG